MGGRERRRTGRRKRRRRTGRRKRREEGGGAQLEARWRTDQSAATAARPPVGLASTIDTERVSGRETVRKREGRKKERER